MNVFTFDGKNFWEGLRVGLPATSSLIEKGMKQEG